MFGYTGGKLTSATDPVGIVSQFTYTAGTNFIELLTTPYGSTAFSTGESGTNRWLNMVNATTGAAERVEYRDNAPGIPYDPAGTVPTGGFVNDSLGMRNSFYWSKKALSMYPPANGVYNYTKAKITHWLLSSDGSAPVATAASEKMPLENRVWYTYAGQPNYSRIGPTAQPEKIARVLADGTTQLSQFEYNSLGNVTTSTDPVGRRFTNVYAANGIDLLERRQTRGTNSELLASFTYNAQHLPLTSTDASSQTTTITYNSRGQTLTSQNPKFETTTYAYGGTVPDGYLKSITSPLFNNVSAVTEFTYDTAHRVLTTTDSDQYVLTFEYDDLDRPTKTTFPDGTWQESKYTDNVTNLMTLDVTRTRDRLGRWSYKHYNSDKQLDEVTDAAGRVTLYGWCGSLETITDANTHVTTFLRDLQGRVYRKAFDDNTAIDYLFEGQTAPNTAGATSRLQSSADARGRRTNYSYFADDNVSGISYTDTAGGALSPPTPSVNYTYDSNYNRIVTMTDGTGVTAYDYYPIESSPALGAGKLHTVDGPLANDTITYTYDQLGRTLSQSVNGVAESVAYDSLGRLTTTDNALGHFSRTYYGVTPRLQTLGYPNGQNANYAYFGNNKDRRLQTLENIHSGAANLSRFDYTYDSEGQIQTLNKLLDFEANDMSLSYDDARQLTGVSQAGREIGYQYDAAGNRIADSVVDSNGAFSTEVFHTYTPNDLNQITNIQGTENGAVIIHGGLVYDLAGNLTDDGEGKTFKWDAANRLSAIEYADSGRRTEMGYDGLGRRVKILEYGPSVTAVIEPAKSSYDSYNTAPLALLAGDYTITFEGLNGGDDLVLIDGVTLTGSSLPNEGFEEPDVSASPGSYEYGPSGATWSFDGQAGIAAKGDLTAVIAEGNQVGFVQGTGSIYQTYGITAGTYSLSFEAAQGANNAGKQRVRVTMRPTATAAQVKTFVWCGTRICEERDGTGATVKKRFFEQGEQRVGGSDAGNYYYSRDHLGSIREVTDSNGAVRAVYDYDPYGNQVVVNGNMTVDLGYTGHYFHAPSGLNLTLYRAYNPVLGRWISRDPIGEDGGVNLYGYVQNSPLISTDPDGRLPMTGDLFLNIIRLAPLLNPDFYRDAERIRREAGRRFPRQENGTDPFDPERHRMAARELALAHGTGPARWAGVANELQGLGIWDLGILPTPGWGLPRGPWNTLPGRLSGSDPWAFQWSDLMHNEEGFEEAWELSHRCGN